MAIEDQYDDHTGHYDAPVRDHDNNDPEFEVVPIGKHIEQPMMSHTTFVAGVPVRQRWFASCSCGFRSHPLTTAGMVHGWWITHVRETIDG